jgi:hypothetical protein
VRLARSPLAQPAPVLKAPDFREAAMDKRAMISFGCGAFLAVVGVIMVIIVFAVGGSAAGVDIAAEGTTLTLTVPAGDDEHWKTCGFAIYIAQSENCDATYAATTVTGPTPWQQSILTFTNQCGNSQVYSTTTNPDDWKAKHDPPLQMVGHLEPRTGQPTTVHHGDYTVTSNNAVIYYALDYCEELLEAVGAVAAMLGVFVVAVVMWIISCILCCVGCCCMNQSAAQSGAPPPVVVGQPAQSA